MTMMPTLDKMPMPSQIMTNGRRATRGVAFIALTKGSRRRRISYTNRSRCQKGRRQ
jgi:hypothetical protein